MTAVIDIGNTNVVIGCIEDEKVVFTSRLRTVRGRTGSEYAALMLEMFALNGIAPSQIEGAIISSVVPPLRAVMQSAVKRLTSKTPLMVGPGIKTGLNILVDNPAKVGSDLIVGAVAAIDKYPLPSIIFDFGTATTVTVLDEKGCYIGYMIMPGLRGSLDALCSNTTQLPHIGLDTPPALLGKNTVDAMRSGSVIGCAAMVDGIIERIESETLKRPAAVIATGGLTPVIIPHCRRDIIFDDELLLHGLWVLYKKNAK